MAGRENFDKVFDRWLKLYELGQVKYSELMAVLNFSSQAGIISDSDYFDYSVALAILDD